MRRAVPWLFYGGLILAAFAIALATEAPKPLSRLPSVDNPAPEGLRALFLQLTESGLPVTASRSSFEQLPPVLTTLVVVAPEAREISAAEVTVLQRRVERGLELVYVLPSGDSQPMLSAWLNFSTGRWLIPSSELDANKEDPLGTNVEVWEPYGVFHGVKALRADAQRSIVTPDESWLPVAGLKKLPVAAWKRQGRGSVLVLSGSDLAENRRIGLGDNLALWRQLAAKGPLAFDEFHHVPAPSPGFPKALVAVLLQLVILAGVWIASRAIRFGPPRPALFERHRSTREYLEAMARLTRRAKVEPALVLKLKERLRRVILERVGLAITLSDAEVARELAIRKLAEEGPYLSLVAALETAGADRTVAARDFAGLAHDVAVLEARIEGRHAA